MPVFANPPDGFLILDAPYDGPPPVPGGPAVPGGRLYPDTLHQHMLPTRPSNPTSSYFTLSDVLKKFDIVAAEQYPAEAFANPTNSPIPVSTTAIRMVLFLKTRV